MPVDLKQACKIHVLCAEYSEDEEEEDDLAQEFFPSPPLATSCPSPGLSLLSLSVSVDTARLSMLLHINDKVSIYIYSTFDSVILAKTMLCIGQYGDHCSKFWGMIFFQLQSPDCSICGPQVEY